MISLAGCAGLRAAKALLATSEDEIRAIQDYSRELLAKAIFLASRLAFITISNTKDEVDGQEDRQLNYYPASREPTSVGAAGRHQPLPDCGQPLRTTNLAELTTRGSTMS